jgi:hypothetical protein
VPSHDASGPGTSPRRGNFFIFNLFLKQILNLTPLFFIFKSNTVGRAKVRGAVKTRYCIICIGAARSVTSVNDFHMEIRAVALPLAWQYCSTTLTGAARRNLRKIVSFLYDLG